ncbi:MAG: lasso peptide biosynthesis B2 protein [Sphingomonas sp.]|uniref:lasso peptide biosynthesis B2 protein n=1 Tax=Sphingomonas sp. TaxID=28214 RepID=UPI003F7EAD34
MRRDIGRKIGTLAGVGWRRQALVVEASASMLAARLKLLRPFPRVARRLGEFVPPADPRVAERAAATTPDQAATARAIGWAVKAAAPFMPFRSVCLQQAMAAQMMLRRRGIASVMHFGASPNDQRAIAGHAWLDAAGVKVTGYPIPPEMGKIACFV